MSNPSMEKAGNQTVLRERIVPMEVLVLGLSRTATTSIRAALFKLNHFDVYDYNSVHETHGHDVPIWVAALEGKFEGKTPFTLADWDHLLGDCMAVSDSPCNVFSEELIAAYPEAKVVLTIRDNVDVWYKSYMDTIWVYLRSRVRPSGLIEHVVRWMAPKSGLATRLENLILKHTPVASFPEEGKKWYLEHNEKIRKLVPKERLLEFNVKEGWEPLCRFLEKEVPDKPFPRLNDTGTFIRHLRPTMQGKRKAAVMLILKGVGVSMALSGVLLTISWWQSTDHSNLIQ